MAESAQSILARARELPGRDRVQLVEELIGSLERPQEAYASDPDALRMLQHVRVILRRLRERSAEAASERLAAVEVLRSLSFPVGEVAQMK